MKVSSKRVQAIRDTVIYFEPETNDERRMLSACIPGDDNMLAVPLKWLLSKLT